MDGLVVDGAACRARARSFVWLGVGVFVALVLWGYAGAQGAFASAPQTQTYSTPGSYSFTVPIDVNGIVVTAVGAPGGDCYGASGGQGASISAIISVTPGEKLFIGVGGAGGGGGGSCPLAVAPGVGGAGGGASGGAGTGGNQGTSGAGGGGASWVGEGSSTAFGGLLVVAGGGGGSTYGRDGGNAGADGADGDVSNSGGGAGNQLAGGAGGTAGSAHATAGSQGTELAGGAGGAGDTTQIPSQGGGGGGGGYYGGGGGGGTDVSSYSGSGGGGSSFTALADTNVSGSTSTGGQPEVTLTYGLPPSAQVSLPTSGGTYTAGQVVATSFSCVEGTGAPGLSSCDDSNGTSTVNGSAGNLDTSTTGAHTYTVTAISTDGQTGTASISYTVARPPTALALPASGGTYSVGQVVATSFGCVEGAGGPGLSSCDDSHGTSTVSGGGGQLDTSTPGVHTYTVTATSTDGFSGTTSISYTVLRPPTALTLPAPGGTYTAGQVVATNFSCGEGAGAPGLSSCDDSNGTSTASGGAGHLNTSIAGFRTYTVTATSTDGLIGTASISYTVLGPPTVRFASPVSGATYAVGQVVATSFNCADATGAPGVSSCDDSNGTSTASGGAGDLDTSTPGAHTYVVSATSMDGLIGTASISYTVAGQPAARLASPASGATYAEGQVVAASFSCVEGAGGPGLSSCDDSRSTNTARGGSGHLDTSTPGAHTYAVTATSTDGQTARTSISYTVSAPHVSIKTARSPVAAGKAKVTVACSGAIVCDGTLTLSVAKSGSRVVVLAATRYSVQGGHRRMIVLPLTRAAVALLTKAPNHRLSVHATATLTAGTAATTATAAVILTLQPPPKH